MFKTVLSAALISGIAAISFAGSAEARGFGGYHGGGYHGGFHKHGFHGGRFYRFHRFHGGRGFGRGFRRFGVNDAGGVSTAGLAAAGDYRSNA
ncbi:hypothetical protein [Methylobacterium oryzisoli]|uniref:hypothetical protein n=1 Tax=Methylobacterium oryzisoli TaxID=3385502 RepID=UPI003891D302